MELKWTRWNEDHHSAGVAFGHNLARVWRVRRWRGQWSISFEAQGLTDAVSVTGGYKTLAQAKSVVESAAALFGHRPWPG